MTHFALSQVGAMLGTSINALGVSHDKSASQIGVAEHLNGTVPPKRPTNADLRAREYLTEAEIERLIKAARTGRYAQRDATLILIAFRHGLRAAIQRCTFVERRRARPLPIPSPVTNCGRYANSSEIRPAHSCSRPSAADHSRPVPLD